jgi:hypothetical protein
MYKPDQSQSLSSKKHTINIMGGSILFLEAQNIKSELLLKGTPVETIRFYTTPRISSHEVLEIVKQFPPSKELKNVYLMIGHDEKSLPTSNNSSTKVFSPFKSIQYLKGLITQKEETSFEKDIYSMPQFDLNQYVHEEYLNFIENTIDQLFLNLNPEKDFRHLINISIIYKYLKQQEQDLIKAKVNSYLKKNSFFQRYLIEKPNSPQIQAGLMYLYNGLELDSNMIMPYFSSLIFRKIDHNLINYLSRLDIQTQNLSFCNSEEKEQKSLLSPLDQLTICQLKNDGKGMLNISLSYIFSTMQARLIESQNSFTPKSEFLNSIFHLDKEQVLNDYLKIHSDKMNIKMLRSNLVELKKLCLKKNCQITLIQYPGFDDPELSKLSISLNLPIINNDPQFLIDIKEQGFYKFFRDNLHRTSGHLNLRGGIRWSKYISTKILESN